MLRHALLLAACSWLTVSRAQNDIAIDLSTDQYGSELIWQWQPFGGGDPIIYSGFPDQAGPGTYPQPTYHIHVPDGNYYFCISDAFDDGYCCGYGQGALTITHEASGTVLFHDDQFSGSIICTVITLPFSKVQGHLYLDADADCVQDPAEHGVPYQVIGIGPGDRYAITDSTGAYQMDLPYGAYTATALSADLVPICPAQAGVPFAVSDSLPFATVDLGDSTILRRDLACVAASGPARPGRDVRYTVAATDIAALATGPITLQFDLDPLLTYVDASPTPAAVNGQTLTWDLPALGAFGSTSLVVNAHVPADAGLVGQELASTVHGDQPYTDLAPGNNTFTAHTTITGSLDPNEKVSWPRSTYIVGQDSTIDYTIRFQNTGTDTAFAIVIEDTLSTLLDMATFRAGASSHPGTVSFKPGRVVEWRLDPILLPDSSTDEANSHGLVQFSIRPAAPLLPGTTITNAADVYFDLNPPVRTDTTLLLVSTGTGIRPLPPTPLLLFPIPATEHLTVHRTVADAALWELRAADGRVLQQGSTASTDLVIDLVGLPSGAYLITVLTEQAHQVARFVKQ